MENKVYIKSTGEIMDVESTYKICTVEVTLPNSKYAKIFEANGIPVKYKEGNTDSDINTKNIKIETIPDSYVDKFKLSNGKTYDSEELIVGIDNIRNLYLNKILENGI